MSLHTSPEILKRIAITLGLGFAFIVMASIFTPERSRADEDAPHGRSNSQRQPRAAQPNNAADSSSSADAHAGLNSLGVIESGRYSIAIYATDAGPRYTIIARDNGEELGTLLTTTQVEQLLPEIDLKSMDFSTPQEGNGEGTKIMFTEPQG